MILILIAELTWGKPIYVGAADAISYSRKAGELANVIWSGNISGIIPTLQSFYEQPDNWGVPFVIAWVYFFTGELPVIAKLFISLIGSGTTLLVYKTARQLWVEPVARLAGILWAFFPLSLFFSAVILKEEFVVFLVMLSTYFIVKLFAANRFNFSNIFFIASSIIPLFFFRTVAAASLLAVFAMTIILFSKKKKFFKYGLLGSVILYFIIFILYYSGNIDFYLDRIMTFQDVLTGRIKLLSKVHSYAALLGLPALVLMSFLSPFPSMVYTPIDSRYAAFGHDSNYYFISGLVVWIFLVYYGLVGGWNVLRSKLTESAPVWGFVLAYILALALTALMTRVRFCYNMMPLFFILIAVGIANRHKFPSIKYYIPFAFALVIAWNYFRLAGRGLIY